MGGKIQGTRHMIGPEPLDSLGRATSNVLRQYEAAVAAGSSLADFIIRRFAGSRA